MANQYHQEASPSGLTPRLLFAALALIGVAIVMSSNVAGVSLIVFTLIIFATPAVLIGVKYVDKVLLGMLLLRPILVTLPEFDIAGLHIGIDGMANLGILAVLLIVLPYQRPLALNRAASLAFIAFLAVCLVSLRLSTDPVFGLRQWIRFTGYFVYFLTAYALACGMPEFRENFRRLIVAVTLLMFAMGGLQMLLMMREVSPVEYVRGMLDAGLDYRLDGFQDYPHIYGNTVMVCAALLIAYAWTTNDNRKKAFYYALAAAAMFAIILTGVRTLIVSVGIMIIVLGVGAGRYKQLAILGALALVAGFGSGIFQARLSAFTDPARALEWNSLADRREIWNVVDLAIEQRPWTGYGLGSIFEYVGASPLRHTSKEFSSHCDYRKFTFEAGIFGGILFAAIWFITGFTAWRRRNKSPEIRHLGPAIAGLAAAFMCSALAEEIFQDFMTMSLFWASAGMVLGTAAPQAAPRETSGNSAS